MLALALRVVEQRLDEGADGQVLVARVEEQAAGRVEDAAVRLAPAAADAVGDGPGQRLELAVLEDAGLELQQVERRGEDLIEHVEVLELARVHDARRGRPSAGRPRAPRCAPASRYLSLVTPMPCSPETTPPSAHDLLHDPVDHRLGPPQHGEVVGEHRDVDVHVAVAGVHVGGQHDQPVAHLGVDAIQRLDLARRAAEQRGQVAAQRTQHRLASQRGGRGGPELVPGPGAALQRGRDPAWPASPPSSAGAAAQEPPRRARTKRSWARRSSSTLAPSTKRANSASAGSGSTTSSFILKALVRRAMAPSRLRSAQKRVASAGVARLEERGVGVTAEHGPERPDAAGHLPLVVRRRRRPAAPPWASRRAAPSPGSRWPARTASSKCSSAVSASRPSLGNGKARDSARITSLASSKSGPKNSRHRVRRAGYSGWRTNSAEVMTPSVPSFCMPGRPPSALLVMSFHSPCLRISPPARVTVAQPRAGLVLDVEAHHVAGEDLAQRVVHCGARSGGGRRAWRSARRPGCRCRCPTARSPCRRRSRRCCRRWCEAQALVGSVAKTSPRAAACSMARSVIDAGLDLHHLRLGGPAVPPREGAAARRPGCGPAARCSPPRSRAGAAPRRR